ncbi:MAG: hypothetical protein EAZ90_27505 [Oscillatoriales cyanobacterium]|nr:MAG: hypothetical protein EAZ90_27505 [Oscillatoriales cyanobacterium]TAE56122.1 MAG: hypothetical protein EAZ88_04845 [Oscillatoriales cyanobacterium]TAF87061.1 MAG: hypothetical protein EAZ49_21530 [Oscillatoriales cyanobacterium]TAG98797.1 MAG: hypothetical protein EAZ19_02455 [Oscillatoriales cyanobacterium]
MSGEFQQFLLIQNSKLSSTRLARLAEKSGLFLAFKRVLAGDQVTSIYASKLHLYTQASGTLALRRNAFYQIGMLPTGLIFVNPKMRD